MSSTSLLIALLLVVGAFSLRLEDFEGMSINMAFCIHIVYEELWQISLLYVVSNV